MVLLGLSLQAGAIVLQPASRQQAASAQIKQANPSENLLCAEAEIDEDEDCGHNQRIQTLRKAITRNCELFQPAVTANPRFHTSGTINIPAPTALYLLLCHFRM